MGVGGLVLAVMGAVWGERRERRFSVVMVGLLLLLALGAHTPLFKILYLWLPGFNKFRGASKFIFLASLFLALLAGTGFRELMRGRGPSRLLIGMAGGVGLLLLAAGWVGQPSFGALDGNWWLSVMLTIRSAGETSLSSNAYTDPAFAQQAGRLAAQSLLVGGATMIVVALLLLWGRRHRVAVWLLLALAVAELFVFARKTLDHFDLTEATDLKVKRFLAAHPGDYRILNLNIANAALNMGAEDLWGYDPGVTRRYAQLLAFTQDVNLDRLTGSIWFSRGHPLFGMFRRRFTFLRVDDQRIVNENTNYLPHLLLVQHYRVLGGWNNILSALTNTAFNPREEVILETPPDPRPVAEALPGAARIVDASTDALTIEAEAPSPSLLLITDAYAQGWRARALPGSSQAHYQILPANYCLRAIPLAAGSHRLRMEYLPSGFVIGKWISVFALLIYGGLVVKWSRGRFFRPARRDQPAPSPAPSRQTTG